MVKKWSVALCCLITSVATGQHTVSVQVTVAPTWVHTSYNRTYLYPESDGQVVEPVFLAGSVFTVGYTTGVTAHYTYAPGWSVAMGAWYSQTSLRQVRSVAAGEGTTVVRSRTVRLPFLLDYQPLTRSLSPYFSLGLLLDFPLTGRVVVTRSGQPTQHLRLGVGSGPVFQPTLGAGVRYQLSPRCAVTVQPIGSYNLGRFGGSQTDNSAYDVSVLAQLTYSL
ncbi:MAG: hypothetical protein JWP57_1215 [Spirosoma sp.]|nr:hypothetical protein [Spirosoma sp.]